MHTVGPLALQVPDGTDEEETFPAQAAVNMAILSNASTFTFGTLSAKPTSPLPQSLYYATDTKALLVFINGAWVWPFASTEAIGTIKHYAGGTVPADPDGVQRWHIADGSAISRTSYPAYYANVGTVWGAGDGSTTVNLPDLRGVTIVGAGSGSGLTNRTLAATGGAETVLADLEVHSHSINDQSHQHGFSNFEVPVEGSGDTWIMRQVAAGSGYWVLGPTSNVPNYETEVQYTAGADTGITGTGNAGNGAGHPNMQPFAVASHIVKIA